MSAATAVFQICETLFEVVVAIVWSAFAYHLCYSAHAKRDQDLWGLARTIIYGIKHKARAEALSLTLLVVLTLLSGFYATLATSVLITDRIRHSSAVYPLTRAPIGQAYLADKMVVPLMSAAGFFKAPYYLQDGDFRYTAPDATAAEVGELSTTHILHNQTSEVYDSLGRRLILNGARAICDKPAELLVYNATSNWHQYSNMECWLLQGQTDRSTGGLPLVAHPAISADVSTLLTRTRSGGMPLDNGDNATYYAETLVNSTEGGSGLVRRMTEATMIKVEAGSGWQPNADVETCMGDNNTRTYVRHSISMAAGFLREFVEIKQCGYDGAVPYRLNYDLRSVTVVAGHITNSSAAKLLLNREEVGPLHDNFLMFRPGDKLDNTAEERSEELRVLWQATTKLTLTGYISKLGYSYRKVAAFTLPVIALFALAVALQQWKQPFAAGSTTENLFMNNNGRHNDCALERKSRESKWWEPEMWAREKIGRAQDSTHISITIGDQILVAEECPVEIPRVKRAHNLAAMKSSADFVNRWFGTPADQRQEMNNFRKYVVERSRIAASVQRARHMMRSDGLASLGETDARVISDVKVAGTGTGEKITVHKHGGKRHKRTCCGRKKHKHRPAADSLKPEVGKAGLMTKGRRDATGSSRVVQAARESNAVCVGAWSRMQLKARTTRKHSRSGNKRRLTGERERTAAPGKVRCWMKKDYRRYNTPGAVVRESRGVSGPCSPHKERAGIG